MKIEHHDNESEGDAEFLHRFDGDESPVNELDNFKLPIAEFF